MSKFVFFQRFHRFPLFRVLVIKLRKLKKNQKISADLPFFLFPGFRDDQIKLAYNCIRRINP